MIMLIMNKRMTKASNPNAPIAIPVGITSSPSPREAYMAKLAVLEAVSP